MQFSNDKDMCLCPSITHLPCPSSSSSHSLIKDTCSKYYQEIGAEMISNQLIIRLEKDKNKSKKKREEWEPPCDCVEIQRPTSKTGPKIINADYDDRIIFRVHSAYHLHGKEDPYKSQTVVYKIGSCKDGQQDNHQCKTITVYPQFSSGTQEVYSDHIREGDQDIFLLRIKKKAEYSEQKNRNVELELRTPKPLPISSLSSVPASAVAPPQMNDDVEDEKESDVVEENAKQPTNVKERKIIRYLKINRSYERKCWQVMLESLIVLTVLNCIFMFSSTVTTCALWWQYQGQRCCPRKTTTQQKFDSRRSKNYTLQTAKKSKKSDFDGYVKIVSKSGKNGSKHRSKRSQKNRSKDLGYQKRSKQKTLFTGGLEVRKSDEKAKISEASQTINDTKSTVVMEFSTVQKVVQIVDNDLDINTLRTPFKEIAIQKDTSDKKRDYNVEQNFEANVATTDS
ncbi:hypothetical protein ALC57_04225 [Trachymyrmex cornetzi]|uniref:Uncharacterized protein n=2 Tax=Trachymyrmex cornetzi TaxID=471704 RepID=A0A195EE17_9HYME|nr:hypothetical protein ALC57_04225 [Trachymyrmex cornetzi]